MPGSNTMSAAENSGQFETIPEVDPESQSSETESLESDLFSHASVSHALTTPSSTGASGESDGEASGMNGGPFSISFESGLDGGSESDESQFENVEGFQEATESAQDSEATRDAWFAEASEAEQQEFFAFLAPLLLPLAKSVVPALASAAAKNLPGALSMLMQRLGRAGKPRRRETAGFESMESGVDEAMIEAAAQQLETIVDFDDRVQILNTTVVPWRRICHLQIVAANGSRFLGSGALIGPRTVITAGHCVFMKTQGGWPASITVTPGRNGSSRPFGSVEASELRSVRGWVNSQKREFDYGAIILPPSFAVRNPSAFGFAAMPDTALRAKKLNTAGYPGDKPAGTMWFAGRRARDVTPRTLVYNTATMGGQSGSPVWVRQADGQRVMVGIHTNGAPSGNSATRITAPVMANMKRWRDEAAGATAQPRVTRRMTRSPQTATQGEFQDVDA